MTHHLMENNVSDILRQHFLDLLMPRNHGLIVVSQVPKDPPKNPQKHDLRPGTIVVSLGIAPFLYVEFDPVTVTLKAKYPYELRSEMSRLTIPPKSPKPRRALAERIAHPNSYRVNSWPSSLTESSLAWMMTIDLCVPDALTRAEFFANCIITTMKSIVTKYGDSIVLKDPKHEFKDLFVIATLAYDKKVLHPKRKRRCHG